ncbi:Na+/H+ antiporter [Spirosoma sp. KUDC1026]|uniref:Na+/H+ antiporter n=1 Tax=Spirosoma sp. KUDC1026 TaxID=2745947 RepID=UPI00159B8596|nr:Na+/H+ antiporter [Spirosoma sp. KUDC1026]QKZ13848.1 Na+/H+ antiporter [Spirosoma sp. KUDC1026]
MHPLETVILLLVFVLGLAMLARRIHLVFPILLTVGGLVIGLVPGLPQVVLDPSVVLLVFLPPVLYSAAWYTNWSDFRRYAEPVIVLALGLVLVTSLGVAWLAHAIIPGFTIAMGLLLGAIVSPSDAVAATAIMKTQSVPRKIVTILEGESLVNDASALVLLQLALAAVSTGAFSLGHALLEFVLLSGGGIGVGLVVGFVSYCIHRHAKLEPGLETILTFVTAYLAYLVAEHLHLSGVLSVVTAGLFIGHKQSRIHSPIVRMQAVAVWDFVIVLLNGLIFILIGLQLPHVVSAIKGESTNHLLAYGIGISLTVVIIRFGFIFMADTLSNQVRKLVHLPPIFPSRRYTTLLAYISMRGIVSLAAVLSIPEHLPNGSPFPGRNLILFITFCVILFTLVVQGVLLPVVIRALAFGQQPTDYLSRHEVRKQLSQRALRQVQQLVCQEKLTGAAVQVIVAQHQMRAKELAHMETAALLDQHQLNQKLMLTGIQAQRDELINLRDRQQIDVELFHELENELDREEIQWHPVG